MVHANCEVYTDKNDCLCVLTHVDPCSPYACSFLRCYDPEDYSINLDKRVIKFHLQKPNQRTYKEWNDFLAKLNYPELYLPMRPVFGGMESVDLDEIAEGFEITPVPKNAIFRIIGRPMFDDFGDYVEDSQVVEIFDQNDWLQYICPEMCEETK